jgi:hypothetical protein
MMFVRSLVVALVAAVVSAEYLRTEPVASSSTCVCTTVPCPVEGTNTLTNGKNQTCHSPFALFFKNLTVVSSHLFQTQLVERRVPTSTPSTTAFLLSPLPA